MNPGPPALYQLKTERKYIHGANRKVRQWTYGQKDRNKQNKVILLVGETGAGKTTIINTMINHLLGVKFEDEEWYEITDEDEEDIDETQSQTREITVYEAFVEENPTSLTIIDTPGFGHTEGIEKDREISEYLTRLFSDEDDGIRYIDAVCFVMKASQNRLSDKEHYIFHSVLSLFSRDIENNIVFLLTQSDGGPPTGALNAIKKAQIPCRRDVKKIPVHFSFSNKQKEKKDKQYEEILRLSWEMGKESMNDFLKLLEEKNRKSVEMTLAVLQERRRLEACVSNLKDRIDEKESKIKELTEIQEAVTENRDKIEKCEKFQFTVTTTVKEKVSTVNEWWWNGYATCCSDCEENCHESCWCAIDPSWCEVMKHGHCLVCTGKCHHSKHVRENKKYVIEIKTVTMTFIELKKEYERTGKKPKTRFDKKIFANITEDHKRNMKESENKRKIEEQLKNDLEKIKIETSRLLDKAYTSIMSLSKIALKADSAFTLQHLDFLIPRLKEEGKDEGMKKLEDLRKAGEEKRNKGAVRHLMNSPGQKLKQFDNRVTEATASSTHHHRRKSLDEPPEIIVGVIRLKDEFMELYERDYPQLQQCTERLHGIIETFEKGYRRATGGSRDAGRFGIAGLAVMVVGLLALFTLGTSLLTTAVAVIGAVNLIGTGITSVTCSSEKERQMTQLTQDVESELEEFQDKITPMAEKMTDIQKRTEKILNDHDAIRIEDIAELTRQMSDTIHLIASVTAVFGRFSLVLDMFSVYKNSSVLNDMNRLADTAIPEHIDEREMASDAGKLIVEMRKLMNQLQNILDKLEKTKDKIVIY
ncbi:hypothetical protein R3I93_001236 [Phoxinus phoxinus]|uniref:AAA+ ATPase domain-containing protein n=1 Tax=Phoxinus phoxinus TaxID=58324 RepID=A0AAN9DPF7_9TELE